MTETSIAAPLAAALAARGYSTLTDVQSAILAPEAAGRDLLVSAQTGSGKTVAFGLAIAPDLLAGADRFLYADKPLALAIAPTRELALQVARELGWLYEGAAAQIATCVGGMDYRTERRALERGAHIVVGTPGRLRDHVERGGLDLSAARAVVLDEADEMLDLGFQEDLEFLLSAAPAERRTLMFSATVPDEIEKLARTYQKDALRVAVQSATSQHADIDYRAYSVTARDREHAIFNILRLHEAQRAIVFCKTRANVNHLLARMGNRGFPVVALSGELSQTERTHALQALRDGRARVCIATDVAARGIDLPGLELVIHADLPGSPETLLHRSGRTGRAGNKGISALVVTPSEFKKAQRILQGAKVVASWQSPPSAEEVLERDNDRLLNHPTLAAAPGDEADLARRLIEAHGADQVAAAFIRLWREGRSAPEELMESAPPAPGPAAAPRERGEFGPSVWFRLSVGHSGRAEARWLLPKICEAGAITRSAIGAIRVKQDESYVQILADQAHRFGETVELDRDLTMTRMAGEPDFGPPARRPASPRPASARPAPDRGDRGGDRGPSERPAKKPYQPKPPRVVEDTPAERPAAPRPAEVGLVVERPAQGETQAPRPAEHRPAEYRPAEHRTAEHRPAEHRTERAPRSDSSGGAPRAKYGDRAERAPYAPREDRTERKPYAPRPERTERTERTERSPRPEGGPRKPWADRPERGERPERSERTERKPYARPADPGSTTRGKPAAEPGERKPRWKADASEGGKPAGAKPRSSGFKSHGGSAAPTRAQGYKSHAKSDVTRDKPAPKAPAKPKADARDTSKRFVPPKKPKG